MLKFSITSANVYRHAQHGGVTTPLTCVNFHISGLRRARLCGYEYQLRTPHLILLAAGDPVEFVFGPDRENWVIQLDCPDIWTDASDPRDTVWLQSGDQRLRIPRATPVSDLQIAHLRTFFEEIKDIYHDPSDLGQLRAASKVVSIFGFILDRHAGMQAQSTAGKLKRLIDSDEHWDHNIDELSRACGFSPDHLRRIFIAEFGIKPHAYRHRRRIIQVTQALADTALPIEEISRRFGFRHVSHLSLVYKKATGMTPTKARSMSQR